ncbi:MarR family winged helix-turn-helix transcriptional regulator [Dermatobacter hominis]|uniref:MarR family winged helix-turn-helix transcriptional regulator n=1 Tax=Dermatobacter hominis TaxID=2884263 RepID=UPI0035ABCA90
MDEVFPLLVADVFELAGALRRAGDRLAGAAGQTQARWQLLSVVSEGEWTVPRVADRLGLSRQAVQRVADDLAAEGLVRFDENPSHRRSRLVAITPAGRDSLAAITRLAGDWHRSTVGDLDVAAVERTHQVLREVLDRVHRDTAPTPTDAGGY